MTANKLLQYRTAGYRCKSFVCELLPNLRGYEHNLSISNSHQFIWFRVAKVGTRTLLNEFKKNDVKLISKNQRLIPYPSSTYDNYFKFAVVRNPWDRLVSCWQNKIVDSNLFALDHQLHSKLQNFDLFVDYVETLDLRKTDIHIRYQTELIDVEALDYIGRFESFEKDVRNIFNELGIDSASIGKQNSSNRVAGSYREYYSDQTRQTVARLFAPDIDTFKYNF